MQFDAATILLLGSLLVFVAIMVGKVGAKYGIPALLLFLFTGMLFGSDGLGFSFENVGLAQDFGMLALTVILFTGGMDTKLSVIRPVIGTGILLSTLGVLLTTLLTGGFIYLISRSINTAISFSLPFSLLLAATMSSTDSASVFAILRSQRVHLKENLKPMLELESGSNDPMAYMLTILLIQFLQSATFSPFGLLVNFTYQFAFGLIFGWLFGKFATLLLNKINIPNTTLYPILLLSILLFCFGFCHKLGANGYLATYIAGLTVGNSRLMHRSIVNRFFDGITWLLQIVLFLLLGLLVNPKNMIETVGLAIPVGIFLMFIGRPLACHITMLPFRKLSFRAKAFVSWVGLRGAAPIIFATYPVVSHIEGAHYIFEIVFFITLLSLLVQGMTITPVARLLKLATPAPPEGSFVGVEIPEETGANMEERLVTKEMLENGSEMKQIKLDEKELVILVRRKDNFIVPKGHLRLHEKDVLLIVSQPDGGDDGESGTKMLNRIRQLMRK